LRCHREELLTFLNHEEVPSDNNGGKRGIRPAVLIRKNSYGIGSEKREASADQGCSDDHYARTQRHADTDGCLEIHVRPGHLKTLPTKSTANS
jgi:hypothetical protein